MKKVSLGILCIILIFIVAAGAVGCRQEERTIDKMDMLQTALGLIEANYIGELDVDDLDFVAAEAVLDSLDNYTYLTDTLYAQTSDSSIGIVMTTTQYNEHLIKDVVKGFPADATFSDGFHLQRGDEIYAIANSTITDEDGNPVFNRVRGLSKSAMSKYTTGEEGTVLTLRIVRAGVQVGDYAYTKQKGYVPKAQFTADVFGDGTNVGYISLKNFTKAQLPDGTVKSAADDFKACMTAFQETAQTKLILDLRGNGGGSTDDLAIIASYFVPLGNDGTTEILELQYKKSKKVVSVTVKEDNYIPNLPLVILCDGDTASAAEALIGACRAYNKANTTVIGQSTFGKGVFQKTEPIYDENVSGKRTGILDQYYVVMVNGYYYIVDPSAEGGRYNIHEKPLSPDLAVKPNEILGALTDDAEMQKAKQVLSR